MSIKHSSLSYIPELDGIRGIAILLVMIFHIGNPIFRGGFIGVDIFFVLSGFLITSLLLKEYDLKQKISLKNFYIRRALRLAPALLIILFTIAVLSPFLYSHEQAINNYKSILISLFYSANWVRAFHLHKMGFLNHTWSLSIEEQFYFIWPCCVIFMFKLCKSRKQMLVFVVFIAMGSWLLKIILTLYNYPSERMYNGLDTRADSLLTGCILAFILSTNLINLKSKAFAGYLKYMAGGTLLLYLVVLFNIGWSNHHVYYWLGCLVQVSTAILILHVFLSDNSIIKKFLSNKILVWIGSISYGLYLWHDPIYETLRMWGYSKWFISTFGVLTIFIITSISFYFVEKPILRLKNKFSLDSDIKEIELKTKKPTPSKYIAE